MPNLRHVEYFHDHSRLEEMLFDGILSPVDGIIVPDQRSPGHGYSLKEADAESFRIA